MTGPSDPLPLSPEYWEPCRDFDKPSSCQTNDGTGLWCDPCAYRLGVALRLEGRTQPVTPPRTGRQYGFAVHDETGPWPATPPPEVPVARAAQDVAGREVVHGSGNNIRPSVSLDVTPPPDAVERFWVRIATESIPRGTTVQAYRRSILRRLDEARALRAQGVEEGDTTR